MANAPEEVSNSEPQSPAEAAASSVEQFKNANTVVFVLSLLGAGILAIVGLVPQCPPLSPYCYESEKVANFTLTAIAVASAIVSWWVWAFGQMASARVALAVDQAK